MSFESFIARRILFDRRSGGSFSRPIIRLSVLAVALGMTVMILSVTIVTGFRREIEEKVIGFGSHIQITGYDPSVSFEATPVSKNQPFYPHLDTFAGVRHIQVFATKPGILKSDDEIQGVLVKGIGSDFDWNFFNRNITAGKIFSVNDSVKTDSIIISKQIASKLKLNVNDTIRIYFLQEGQPRPRRFFISGIYETGMGDQFDPLVVVADIGHLRRINGWEEEEVGGFEVLLDNIDDLDAVTAQVNENIGYELHAQTIKEIYPPLFDWLGLLNMNTTVILIIMLGVAVINMVTALLIIILERSSMIGILKALGAAETSVEKIFLFTGGWLILAGMGIGNGLGIILSLAQKFFHIVKLDQESYYVSVVPIDFSIPVIIALNAATFLVTMIVLILPALVVSRMTPVRSIRFK